MARPQLHVTVIRHGETNSNLNHILQGQIDTKLNRTGREQAEILGRRLRKLKIDHIYTSDLTRAKKTAEAIAKHHPDTPLSTDIRIRERDLGRLSGLSIHEALDFIKDEGLTWDDYGEPEEDFKAQVIDFFNDMVEKHLPKNSELLSDPKKRNPDPKKRNPHIVIVTHGGTIGKLVKEHIIMNLGFHVNDYLSLKHKAKNTSVTKFVVRRKKAGDDSSNVDDDDATSVASSDNNSVKDDDNNSEKAVNTRRNIERKVRLEGEVKLWSCVSHLSSLGKRTHGDSQIDEFVH